MKTFAKVMLLLIVAVIAIKLLPLIFGLGWLVAGAVLGFVALGVSATIALMGSALVLVVLLSPVWVPFLAIFGLILLIQRNTRQERGVVV